MNRPLCLIAMTAAMSLLAFDAAPRLAWNATASAPRGWWTVVPDMPLRVGDWALVRPGPGQAAFLAGRRYLPSGAFLLKRKAAGHGQTICRLGAVITIDGRRAGVALAHDRMGRALPTWSGCHRLQRGEVFFMNAALDSLDGRYLGPSEALDIVGRAEPLCWCGRT